MSLRQRIQFVIDSRGDLTVRSVSLGAGMSDSALHKFLTGQTDDMKIENAKAVATVLGVDPRWLVFGDGDPDLATDLAEQIKRMSDRRRELIQRLIDEMPKDGTNG